jgi:glycine cleavage system H protein
VKAVSDLYSPLSGEVLAINGDLDTQPGLVNEDPYGAGWTVRMRPDDPVQIETLLDATAYGQSTVERS